MSMEPLGEERQVRRLGGVSIDGAPVSYVVALAAVIAALAFVPLSVILGSGKSFPMSQAVYPLVGWLLGPVAGAVANGIGALIGVFLAPHTTTVPLASVLGAAAGGLAAGVMVADGPRKWWVWPLGALFVVIFGLYAGRGIWVNGAQVGSVLFGALIDWSALLGFLLPLRALIARWIGHQDLRRVAAGLFAGTWIVAGLAHLTSATLIYYVLNWPNAVWLGMAPFAPLEHLVRCVAGAVIGTGVIAGLRAMGLVKPEHAIY